MAEKEELLCNGVVREETPDSRDYKVARFIPNQDMVEDKEFCLDLPDNLDITKNQNWYSACVGYAFSTAISIITYQKTHKWIDFDPFMIYGTRSDYFGKGMYLRDAADIVYTEGAYLTRDFGIRQEVPQITKTVKKFKQEHPDLVEYAKTFCVEGYAFCNTDEEVKTALKNGMPVLVAYDVEGSMYNPKKNGYVDYPQKGEYRGSHCMIIVGWTSDDHWIVLNSWGSGENGKGGLYIDFREPRTTTISLSDDIVPIKNKCGVIELTIGRSKATIADSVDNLSSSATSKEIDLEVGPYIKNNRTFIPVRFVADALGASVEWDAETGTATLRSEENIIKLKTNDKWMQVSDYKPVVWKKIKMDTAPHIVNDRMMIPIRYIAENLNCDVQWDGKTSTALIISK